MFKNDIYDYLAVTSDDGQVDNPVDNVDNGGVEDNAPEAPSTPPVPQEYEIDGEKLTLDQIRQFKSGYEGYTKSINDYKTLETQSKEALELYNYLKGNKDLAQKLYEYDNELQGKMPSKEKDEVNSMRQELDMLRIERNLESLKSKDPEVDEISVLKIATEGKLPLDIAYKVWKADNYEASLKQKLNEQSKQITKQIETNNGVTKTLIGDNASSKNVNGNFGLSPLELAYAEKLGMSAEEYSKWK